MTNDLRQILWSFGVWAAVGVAALAADWLTHRSNAARTGSVDDRPGPKAPKVLWVHKSREHFIASPVTDGKALYVSGLGAFNTAAFHALSLADDGQERVLWSKQPPALKLPLVSSPLVVGGKLIFGDGMHQTDGAALHCLAADGGRVLWRLSVPGKLVHIEGSACVAGGRVYFGAGHGGVLCVDPDRVTLDGQEQSLADAAKLVDARWKQLQARYEEDKKKDPDFTLPPNEDSLPRPAPKLLWQQGRNTWHVDAPLAVIGERVLVCTAFLDQEKSGERAVVCLSADNGSPVWKASLTHNPWGGATVAGDLVIIGGSSIRFDPQEISQAKGEVTAINLSDGKVRWRKDLAGGVVSPVAFHSGLAVFTCTDGNVRALDAATGEVRWSYDAKTPFFAAPAIAGSTVYVADLKGVLRGLDLVNGQVQWKLNLATDPAVRSTGMVYGSPIVHGGRLYVGTCNLAGGGNDATAVVCLGDR